MVAEEATSTKPEIDPTSLIARFKDEYGIALAAAETSAEHTATEGWQDLYTDRRASFRDSRRSMAASLKALSERMEEIGLDEDDEKELANIKKASADLRARADVFSDDTLGPVLKPVRDCERIIDQARSKADIAESSAPLIHKGLRLRMKQEIATWHKVRWDEETGVVTVSAPSPKK